MAKQRKKKCLSYTYWSFAFLRFVLTLLPQTGYIHPDEFFQSVEVLAGKTFNYEASLPWEFNVTSPIRSIGVPYFTVGFSYQLLKIADMFCSKLLNTSLLTSYALLVTPRIFICLLSYVVDYTIYKICTQNNEKANGRLVILASSYATLVYCTRTFSNTLEVILFAVLLYYVADSMIFSNILCRQREYLNKRYERTDNPADRAKFHKLRLFLASDSYRHCAQIATVTTLGFFNRPTFLAYAMFPVFFWLYRGIGYKSVSTLQFNTRILALILCAIPTLIFMIIVDSFFYGYITWGEVGMLDVSIDSFVFTPLNFIKYNIDSGNLAKHGLHPRYLHILVNVPLLFGTLGLFAIIGAVDITTKFLQRKFNLLPTVRSIKGLMTMSYIAPTLFLSIFPHQEPRFLLPIVIPLVYLFANKIKEEAQTELVQSEGSKQSTGNTATNTQSTSSSLFRLWIVINILLTAFYGFVHQGGLLKATSHLSKEMHRLPTYHYHVVTSHVYSIPHVLFKLPDPNTLRIRGSTKYKPGKRVFTYEEGSYPLERLVERMRGLLETAADNKVRHRMFLLLTGSKHDELMKEVLNEDLNIRHLYSFYPHVSTEAMPDVSELIRLVSVADVKSLSVSAILDCLKKFITSFDLKLYEVQL